MELKKQKDDSGEEYTWTDYMSLLFTQNVSINTEKSCLFFVLVLGGDDFVAFR